jgi:cell division cycle protein 37
MAEAKKEKEELEHGVKDHQHKLLEVKKKLKEAEEQNALEELSRLKLEVSELEKQTEVFQKKEEELKKKEKTTPLNIDTICHDGKSKTVINKYKKEEKKEMTDEERMDRQQKFQEENETLVKKYGMLRRYEDSQEFLLQHPQLACEETANYLVLWCINLEVQEKHDLMAHVAHQTIVMQFILELAKSLEVDPRNCIRAFFSRIKLAEKQYLDAFNDELDSFKDRVRARAEKRIEEATREVEEEERKKRLGPGGLDPVEVFESLPESLQNCFESKDIQLLQDTLMAMPKEEAEYHLKRCIDSGLWVPNAKDAEANRAETIPEDAASGELEEVYAEPEK